MDGQTAVPSPEQVQREIGSELSLITTALDFGSRKVRAYFDREDQGTVDRNLAPNILRYQAKKYLRKAGKQAADEEDEEEALRCMPVSNNGLFLKVGRYNIRIRKSDDGDIPAPGDSKARQKFYQQPIREVFENNDGEEGESINLLVVWDVVTPYALSAATLACPLDGKETKASVLLHWQAPLPILEHSGSIEAEDLEDDDDLDLELKRGSASMEEE
jgi:hypothetical protein